MQMNTSVSAPWVWVRIVSDVEWVKKGLNLVRDRHRQVSESEDSETWKTNLCPYNAPASWGYMAFFRNSQTLVPCLRSKLLGTSTLSGSREHLIQIMFVDSVQTLPTGFCYSVTPRSLEMTKEWQKWGETESDGQLLGAAKRISSSLLQLGEGAAVGRRPSEGQW